MFSQWSRCAKIKDDACVKSSSPGGATGGEVSIYDCRLVLVCRAVVALMV